MKALNRPGLAGALCALALLAGFSGCQPATSNSKLTIGKVDTAELLHDDPQYQSLSIEYMKENTDLRGKFMEKMRAAGEDQTAKRGVQEAYTGAQRTLDAKWMGKTQEFLESRHSSIRDTAEKVAQSKDIDMVIIDSEVYPTTEWGGVDITKDLALSLSQGGTVKPAASATPGKKGS